MKNLSLLANAVLAIGLVVIYVLHFSSTKNIPASEEKEDVVEVVATEEKEEVIELPKLEIDSSISQAGQVIAYVNVDSLIQESTYIQRMSRKIEQSGKVKQDELMKEDKQLKEDYQRFLEIYQANGFSSQEEITTRQQNFEQRNQSLQLKQQQMAFDLEKEQFEQMKKINKKISSFLKEYAKNSGYSIILSTGAGSTVLYAESSMNITKPVLEGFNAQYK